MSEEFEVRVSEQESTEPGTYGDFARLTEFLKRRTEDTVVLSLAEIEGIIGGPLLLSACKYTSFWSNSRLSYYSRFWRDAGYAITLRGVAAGHVGFRRAAGRAVGQRRPVKLAAAGERCQSCVVGVQKARKRPRMCTASRFFESSGSKYVLISAVGRKRFRSS
jgi:hypothetical protein